MIFERKKGGKRDEKKQTVQREHCNIVFANMSNPNLYNYSENSADHEDDSDSDSDGCVYYNEMPKFTPPPTLMNANESPQPVKVESPTPRPRPPPRRRSNNSNSSFVKSPTSPSAITATARPESPLVEDEDGPSRVVQNQNYETHILRSNNNTVVSQPQKPSKENDVKCVKEVLQNYPWYRGDISRSDTEQKLKDYPDGSFLLRDSTTPNDYTLTVRKDGQSKCLKVYQKNGKFGLKVHECGFDSVPALIEHYSQHSLAEYNRRLDVKLTSWPKQTRKRYVNRYAALSALANKGRELQRAKQQYIELTEKQVKYSKNLNAAQIQETAYQTAQAMYSELLAPAPRTSKTNDFVMEEELSEERKEILEANKRLAMDRHQYIEIKASQVHEKAGHMECIFNSTTIELNKHVEVLRDKEQNCENMRTQLLEDGAKRELVECLVEECSVAHPDPALWLVDCTREEAIQHLKSEPAGTFLIRPRDYPEKPYALSIVTGNEDGSTAVKHCVIDHPLGKGYGFRAEGAVFESIDELVCKHSKTSIKVYFAHMDTCLDHPLFGARPKSLGDVSDDNSNPYLEAAEF